MGISTPAVTIPTYARPQGGFASYSPPIAPSALSVTPAATTNALSWVSNSTNETGFQVERATVFAGPFTVIATKGAGATTHPDTSLADGTYYYRVKALRGQQSSAYTSVVSGTISTVLPAVAPTITASRINATTIRFTFLGGSGATTWVGYRRTPSGSGSYTADSTLVAQSTPYKDVTVSSGGTADYYIAVTNAAGTVNSSVVSGSAASGVTWAPNRPSGLTNIVDRQWNPTDGTISGGVLPPASLSGTDSTGMQWFAASGVAPLINTPASLSATIGQTIPALPDSNATCMAIRYPSGFSAGNTPFGIFVNSVPLVRRMYISTWVCMPAGFNPSSNNIKWVFFAQNGSAGRNHVVMLSSGSQGNEVGPWIANQGGGGSFNIGGNNNTKSGATVNLTNSNLPALKGTWMNVEWEMTLETTPGVTSDGICKMWVNNVLRGHWTNIRYNASGDPAGFDTVSFTPYYGGGGSAAPSNQYICVGRFLVAGAA